MDEKMKLMRDAEGYCNGLVSNCRNCDWYGKINEGPENCPECGADRFCNKKRVPGHDTCRQHRGPRPELGWYGRGNPSMGGGLSKFPVLNLASKYHKMVNDPKVISVRHALEMVRTRAFQLFGRLDNNDSPERIKNITAKWEKLKTGMPKQYLDMLTPETRRAFREMDAEMEKAYHDYAAWKQIFEAFNLERNLVESELKVIREMRMLMTQEDGYELVAKLMAAILEVVHDPTQLKAIQYHFIRIVGDDDFIEAGRRSEAEGELRSRYLDIE